MSNESTVSSSDSTAPHQTRRENSPDHSIRADGPVAQGGDATIHDRTGLYLAIIAILFAAMAFGMSIVLPMVYSERTETLEARIENLSERAQLAEREARVATERWNDLKVELAKRNIPVSDH